MRLGEDLDGVQRIHIFDIPSLFRVRQCGTDVIFPRVAESCFRIVKISRKKLGRTFSVSFTTNRGSKL